MMDRDSVIGQIESMRNTLLAMDENYRSQGCRVSAPEVALGLKAMRELTLSLEINGLKDCFKGASSGSDATD